MISCQLHQEAVTFCFHLSVCRHGLDDIGLLFMPDHSPESGKKMLQSMSVVYMKPGKQPSDTISYLSNLTTSTINLICIEAILLSKRGLGAFLIVLRC